MAKKTEYIVIPDTNALFSVKPEELISPSFEANWVKCSEIAVLQFCVPSVVARELAQQKAKIASEAVANAKKNFATLCATTGIKPPDLPGEQDIRDSVSKRINDWITTKGGQIISTPYQTIDWESIELDSVWRNPPFEKDDSEKGFRDRLILETVAHILSQSANAKVAFVCSDKELQNATNTRLANTPGFWLCESFGKFTSEVELLDLDLDKEFVKSILNDVAKAFYTAGHDECVFSRFAVKTKIVAEHQALLTTPFNDELWAETGQSNPMDDLVEVGETAFERREGKKTYFWKTKICLRRRSIPRYALGISSVLDLMRTSEFNVTWKCDISPTGNLSKVAMVGTEFIEGRLSDSWLQHLPQA